MRRSADAVIIGGGVNGASIAYHLAARGCADLVLLEKGRLSGGGTGRSAALIRQHYTQDPTVRMAVLSHRIFESFAEHTGGSAGYVASGWVFLTPPEVADVVTSNLERQRALGVEAREISHDELRELLPGISTEGIGRVVYEPRSGYADPVATTAALAARARALGVEVREGSPARGIRLEGRRVAAVETDDGPIATRTVVDAAGPWGDRVGAWVGLNIPIAVTLEHDAILDMEPSLRPALAVSNMVDRVYHRPRTARELLIGRGHPKENDPADPDAFDAGLPDDFTGFVTDALARRFPATKGKARAVDGWGALYDVTPDWHPILGRVPEVEGFICAVGFSGHGFKLAPAIGQLIAEEVLDGRAHTIDLTPFRLGRFAVGELLIGSYGGNRA